MINIPTFKRYVYSTVAQIPRGKVATYGQIAWLAGYPNNARLVGRVLKGVSNSLELPCHRVVNSQGKLSICFAEQRKMLIEENIAFSPNGYVNLKIAQWQYMLEDDSLTK